MAIKFSNNAVTALITSVAAGNGTFSVADVSTFPTIAVGAGDYAFVTLIGNVNVEVVKVTAIDAITKVFTFERLAGSANNTFVANDACELRATSELLTDFDTRIRQSKILAIAL